MKYFIATEASVAPIQASSWKFTFRGCQTQEQAKVRALMYLNASSRDCGATEILVELPQDAWQECTPHWNHKL